MPTADDHDYIIEFFQVGNSMKVTAFDPHSLTEASIVGSPKVSKEKLARLAIRKLKYVMNKRGQD